MSSIALGQRAEMFLFKRRSSAVFIRARLHATSTPSFASVECNDNESAGKNFPDDPPGASKTILHNVLRDLMTTSINRKNLSKSSVKESSEMRLEVVDRSLIRFLVGKGGSVKDKIEKDHGVKLSIPGSGAKDGSPVRISGSDPAIKAACKAIEEVIADSIQSKLQYSHFISLPLASHSALVEKLAAFQDSILSSLQRNKDGSASKSSDEENTLDKTGIEKSIFIRPAAFHLTILMLKLWNEERVQAASSLLKKIMPVVHESLGRQPVVLDLQGIECLRGTPAKADVLYAQIQESKEKTRLLEACRILIDAFVESGLVLEKDIGQPLKLHATLMNTSHRKRDGKHKSFRRTPFDARQILDRFGNTYWGQYPILDAHLSQRFVYDENGYYHCVSTIPFP